MSTPHWTEIKKLAKSRQLAAIPEKWRLSSDVVEKFSKNLEKVANGNAGENAVDFLASTDLLTKQEREITEAKSATFVLEKIRAKKWSCEQVTSAFCHRAALAHQLTNCCTEMFFEEAIKQAKELDAELKAGKSRGPLHGLPISLKDQHKISGQYASIGYFAWALEPVKDRDESDMVVILRNLGAVFYCKTNVPQSLLAWDSDNPLFSKVLNPYNTNLIPGGSSGGEGALIACRGSILGVGSDIGGSIRIPSNFCGVKGFKPTTSRLPGRNYAVTGKGQILVPATIGPLGVAVEDLNLLTKSVIDTEPWEMDPNLIVPVPWKSVKLPKKLKIGYYETFDFLHTQPPVRRAVQETVEKLKKAGHELVSFTPPDPQEALMLLYSAFTQDGGADIRNTLALAGEPYAPSIAETLRIAPLPRTARSFIATALRFATGDELIPKILSSALGPFSGEEADGLNKKVANYRVRMTQAWKDARLDAIICPVNACVAPPHQSITELIQAFIYTGVWNLVDYPAGVLPVLKVSSQDSEYGDFKLANAVDKNIKKWWEKSRSEYDGVPVGVQIVTMKWKDEECLELMKQIESLLQN